MPNWCMNRLHVEGAWGDIQRLQSFVEGEKVDGKNTFFSLNAINPLPQSAIDNGTWYDWCLDNWGTKWDVDASEIDFFQDDSGPFDGSYWIIEFDSAWGPPLAAIDTLAQKFPELLLELYYDEPGNDFAGSVRWEQGQISNEESYPSPTAQEWNDELFEEVWTPVNVVIENPCKRN